MGSCNGTSSTGKCMTHLKQCKKCGGVGCDNSGCTHQLFAFGQCRVCGCSEWIDYKGQDPNKSQACLDADMHKTIQAKAYLLWEKQGKPHGKDEDIWWEAEEEVKRQR